MNYVLKMSKFYLRIRFHYLIIEQTSFSIDNFKIQVVNFYRVRFYSNLSILPKFKIDILKINILKVQIKVEMHYILDWNIKLEYLRLDQIGINTQTKYMLE